MYSVVITTDEDLCCRIYIMSSEDGSLFMEMLSFGKISCRSNRLKITSHLWMPKNTFYFCINRLKMQINIGFTDSENRDEFQICTLV